MVKIAIMMVFFSSCARLDEQRNHLQLEWIGKSKMEIENHPYFRNLKHIKKSVTQEEEVLIYSDQTPIQTDAYCQSLGGCLALPIYNCQHRFRLKGSVVKGLEQLGTCPPSKFILPLRR